MLQFTYSTYLLNNPNGKQIKKNILLLALIFLLASATGFYTQDYLKRDISQPNVDSVQQHLNIGITYIRYGRQYKYQKNNNEDAQHYYLKAHQHFNQALILKPDCPQAYCYIGITFREQGNNKGAFDALKQAVTIDKNYGEAYFHLAGILVEEKEFEQAISLYKQMLTQQPNNKMVQAQLNQAYLARSRYLNNNQQATL